MNGGDVAICVDAIAVKVMEPVMMRVSPSGAASADDCCRGLLRVVLLVSVGWRVASLLYSVAIAGIVNCLHFGMASLLLVCCGDGSVHSAKKDEGLLRMPR